MKTRKHMQIENRVTEAGVVITDEDEKGKCTTARNLEAQDSRSIKTQTDEG